MRWKLRYNSTEYPAHFSAGRTFHFCSLFTFAACSLACVLACLLACTTLHRQRHKTVEKVVVVAAVSGLPREAIPSRAAPSLFPSIPNPTHQPCRRFITHIRFLLTSVLGPAPDPPPPPTPVQSTPSYVQNPNPPPPQRLSGPSAPARA